MTACRARHLPPDDQVSFTAPSLQLSPIDTPFPPWRSPPHSCDFANPSESSSHPFLSPGPPDIRAKSTPPFDPRQARPVYPSPPLTDAAPGSTVPLPDVQTDPPISRFLKPEQGDLVDENMSHDALRHIAPLSPPPTLLVAPKELPWGEDVHDGEHSVETWTYGDGNYDGCGIAPIFPPVRDDSGFEEFVPSSAQGSTHKLDDAVSMIEPTSAWVHDSPLSLDEGLPLVAFPPFHPLLSGSSSGAQGRDDVDVLISPVSSSDAHEHPDSWITRSEMEWSPSPTFVETLSPPSSPKPHDLSLAPFDLASSLGFDPHCSEHFFPAQPSPPAEDHSPFFPLHGSPLSLPADLDDEYPDTVMPSDDDDSCTLPPSSPCRRPLNDLYDATPPFEDVQLTPAPRSPHHSPFNFHDFDEPPSSPHSPHTSLPEIEGLFDPPSGPIMDTISPALLGGAPDLLEDSLRLDLRPLSDPPYMRSPSPDEDELGFLDLQFDPELSQVGTEEFLQLRALRRCALAQESSARALEDGLNERITAVAGALLPPSRSATPDPDAMQTDAEPPPSPAPSPSPPSPSPPLDPRTVKRELQALMDMRTDARRTRKAQKHRSKEIGALLDLKTHAPMLPIAGLPPVGGKCWTRSIAHLVAHMMFHRRERARPLENKLAAHDRDGRPGATLRPSGLRVEVAAEDEDGQEECGDGNDDMEM